MSVGHTSSSSPAEKRDYGSARAYAEEVHKWAQSVRCWMAYQQIIASTWAFQTQQQYSMMYNNQLQQSRQSGFGPLFQQQQQQHLAMGQPNQRNNGFTLRLNLARIFRSAGTTPGVPQTIIVQQHTIPSFVRRIAAEAIDSCILFLFKLLVVYLLVDFELIELEQFERILSNESDIQTLIDVTQELFYIELICKLFSALIEALFITYGLTGFPMGCTPGKHLLRIRVVSCLDIQIVPGTSDRVTITSLPNVNLKSSLARSLIKNMLISFLFPLSTALYLFNYNRAIYDLAAKTVVVAM